MHAPSLVRPLLGLAVAAVLAALIPTRLVQAQATDAVAQANAFYAGIRADKRSDTLVLPALAKLDPPPPGLDEPTRAALLPASSASFAAASAWAAAPNQQALISAIAAATKDENHQTATAWGQPYGTADIDPALVSAGLCTELGDPPVLSGARFRYLDALTKANVLVQIEATRLQNDGKAQAALDTLLAFTLLARQITDREFLAEKIWGVQAMGMCLNRMRDVAYADSVASARTLTSDGLVDFEKRLRDKEGFLGVERIRLPRADRLAAEQAVARIFAPDGTPDEASFGPTLARARTGSRPLRLFSESARWDGVRKGHANARETAAQVEAVFADWQRRWSLAKLDPVLALPTDYARMDKTRFAAVAAVLGDVSALFIARDFLRLEASGTRHALGLYGYMLRQRSLPPDLSAIRPRYIAAIEPDPWSPTAEPLHYFRPITDQSFPADQPKPSSHAVKVVPTNLPVGEFTVQIGPETFVLYSVGPDGKRDWARVAGLTGDLLLWPPVLSLTRQHMADNNLLP